jgi:hypothetical protein
LLGDNTAGEGEEGRGRKGTQKEGDRYAELWRDLKSGEGPGKGGSPWQKAPEGAKPSYKSRKIYLLLLRMRPDQVRLRSDGAIEYHEVV